MIRIRTTRLAGLAIAACVLAAAGAPVSAAQTADPSLVEKGHYLAIAGDCVACHTAPGGKPLAGGLPIATPLGAIISTNITPSRVAGIGEYSLEQFSAALRRGVRGDGARLYPAMPYTAYAKISDEDVQALYAYFMLGVEPVDGKPPETRLPFPFNIRLSMMAWNALYLNSSPFKPDPAKDAEWNRGAYLALSLGHCGTCHTPRGITMAEDVSRLFGGGDLGTWYAPNITSDPNSGIGAWSVDELASYMRDGRADGRGQAAGPMAEAIDHSLRHLRDDDLKAIAAYLHTVPPVTNTSDTKPASAWGAAGDQLTSIRGVQLPADREQWSGPQIYDAYCATCHQAQGQGSFDGKLPPLFHNSTLGHQNTANLAMVILDGVHRQPDVNMPGFASLLSGVQIATLGNFLLEQYGNPSARITAGQVESLRSGGPSADGLILAARAGLAAAIVVVLAILLAIFAWWRRRRQKSQNG